MKNPDPAGSTSRRWSGILPVALAPVPTYTLAKLKYSFRLSITITVPLEVHRMRWEKPSYKDLRFGFEVTMYIYNR